MTESEKPSEPTSSEDTLTARQIRIIQILADLQMAISAIDFMCEVDDGEDVTRIERRRLRCFEDAAVIAYGRAFTEAKGLPHLHWKHLALKPTPDQLTLHERIMDRRRKVVAHSDAERQRILFETIQVFDDHPVMLPRMDFDDALEFYSDRWTILKWFKLVHSAGAAILFKQVQGRSQIRFLRDHAQGKGGVDAS